MARVHLFELHEHESFPTGWRDLLTDYMSFFAVVFRPYRVVGQRLLHAIQAVDVREIVDLGSGAGGSMLSVIEDLRALGLEEIHLTLTDKYPNLRALHAAVAQCPSLARVSDAAVDARDVPANLPGFRTLFTIFHHFRPEAAREILADAVRKGQGIGIFEYTERNFFIWGMPILTIPLFTWLITPFIRPLTWRRILWTYLLPMVPMVGAWDGFVSCLRTYSPAELKGLVAGLPPNTYQWDIGRVRSFGACRITYLIGWPSPGSH